MIELYCGANLNGHMVRVLLEECGLAYSLHTDTPATATAIGPSTAGMRPSSDLPALLDPHGPDGEPLSLFGVAVCLVYLAAKAQRFLPADSRGRYEVLQWLMLEVNGVGPLRGRSRHVGTVLSAEARQLCDILERRLGQSGYIGGADYSIADIAFFTWLRSGPAAGPDGSEHPRLRAWFDEIAARPAVQRSSIAGTRAANPPTSPGDARDCEPDPDIAWAVTAA